MSLNCNYLFIHIFHVPGERVFVPVVGCGRADKPHDLAELLFMSYIFGSLLSSVWLTFRRKMPFWNSKWTTLAWGLTPVGKGKGVACLVFSPAEREGCLRVIMGRVTMSCCFSFISSIYKYALYYSGFWFLNLSFVLFPFF